MTETCKIGEENKFFVVLTTLDSLDMKCVYITVWVLGTVRMVARDNTIKVFLKYVYVKRTLFKQLRDGK